MDEPKPRSFPVAQRAGETTARYLPADPALWLLHCSAAGIVVTWTNSGMSMLYDPLGPVREQAMFLEAWIHATPGGLEAVKALVEDSKT